VKESRRYPRPPLQKGKGAYREVVMRAVKSQDSWGRNRPSRRGKLYDCPLPIIELSRSSNPSPSSTPLTHRVVIKLPQERRHPPGKSKRSTRTGKGPNLNEYHKQKRGGRRRAIQVKAKVQKSLRLQSQNRIGP